MKPILLKSKRLTIHPLDETELKAYIDTIEERDLKNAFNEILRKVHNNPENLPWYTYWQIKERRTVIGGILFYGIPNGRHEAAISYGIEEEYQGQGYEQEAVELIRKWIFRQKAIVNEGGRVFKRRCYYLSVKNEISDIKGRRMLESIGFTMLEPNEDNPESSYCISFEQEAPKYSMTVIGAIVGLMLGLVAAWIIGVIRYRNSAETLSEESAELLPYILLGTVIFTVIGLVVDFIQKKLRKR